MHSAIERILLSEDQIKARIAELGRELTADYAGKNPIFIGVLKGVVMFFADMIRAIPLDCQIDFMAVSSYGGGTQSSGKIRIQKDISVDLAGRHVVILEDILDSGLTLSHTAAYLKTKGPASLKICTLLDKPDRRKAEVQADYVGFTIPNLFVVGYGLDFDENYRNLPYVGVLKPEAYMK
ncbi:MAG TPA: hypoxanthine phosphoribosyltransferase [Candidatus Faecousia gallistercoris]|nr:hypoxanthine phosphoribosyltransferase [Candidatus Faecousia gallistercoris]